MKPIILVPLVALALAAGSAGAYLALSSEDSVEEATVAQPTATPTPAATTMAEPTATSTETAAKEGQAQALQTYRNEKYGYEVALPPGYRVASFFMERFAALISNPRVPAVPEDNVVITSLTEEEERVAVQEASQTVALGLAPWFGFGQGKSIRISLIQSGISRDDFFEGRQYGGNH